MDKSNLKLLTQGALNGHTYKIMYDDNKNEIAIYNEDDVKCRNKDEKYKVVSYFLIGALYNLEERDKIINLIRPVLTLEQNYGKLLIQLVKNYNETSEHCKNLLEKIKELYSIQDSNEEVEKKEEEKTDE